MEIRNLFGRKYSPHILAAATFCTLLLVSEYLFHLNYQHQKGLQQSELFNQAAALRVVIEREINTTLNLAMGLNLFVSTNPEFHSRQFTSIARELLNKAPHLRNIALARNNVITHVYPLEDNKQALGMHYMDIPEQRKAVLRAVRLKKSVIAGPVNLKQGGQGFISRVPIFLAQQPHTYWGIASIVINIEKFYEACGLTSPNTQVRYALRGKDGLGEAGEVFFGPASLFTDNDVLRLPISLPGGQWILAAKPVAGVKSISSPLLVTMRGFGVVVALAVSVMVFALLTSYRRIRYLALHDPLTGLANRRLFFEHVKHAIASANRTNNNFTVIYIDLDDFKPVNDTYGHKHGDHVLKEIARRMTHGLRDSDITARIGGDEFILLMQDTRETENVQNLIAKIEQLICQPLTLENGVTVRMNASVGASVFPEDGTSADELVRYADFAMYNSKISKKQ